jgi:hypothetical protein
MVIEINLAEQLPDLQNLDLLVLSSVWRKINDGNRLVL